MFTLIMTLVSVLFTAKLKKKFQISKLLRNFVAKFVMPMNLILQCAVLFGFLAAGELIVYLTSVPVPSSIIGMILLAASLESGRLKLHQVEHFADFLTRNLGFFFVPAGVGVMRCLGLISDQWLPIVTAVIVSTFIIIAVTGWTHQWARRLGKRYRRHD